MDTIGWVYIKVCQNRRYDNPYDINVGGNSVYTNLQKSKEVNTLVSI